MSSTTLKKVNERSVRIILGVKLRQFRTAKQLSLTELSKISGVSVSYLTEIEKAKKFPKPEKLSAIAQALEVNYNDLTSLELDRRLAPLGTLLNNSILEELPLELFGLDPGKILDFFMTEPDKIGAFLQTLIQLMRLYEMNVEQFFFSALRAYQELKDNYFEDLEKQAAAFRKQFGEPTAQTLRGYLENQKGVMLDTQTLNQYSELASMRSVWVPGTPPRLLLNSKLSERQLKFILAREAGFHFMEISPRPTTFSYVKPSSFQLILNNYRASYFAGALLMAQDEFVHDLQQLFAQRVWQEARFRALMHKYDASPEMVLHRITSLAPKFLGLKTLFFLRFSDRGRQDSYAITKELHLSGLHSPHANLRYEHYCRRWVSLEVLKKLSDNQQEDLAIGIQRSSYIDSGKEYLVLSVARRMFPTQHEGCSVSVGFELNTETKNRLQFVEQIPEIAVNETCERCALKDCQERAVPPSVWQRKEQRKKKSAALRKLKAALSEEAQK